ncbi:integrase/recombinase xerD homolog [Amphiura filiformis]|uniref:integrase/recombinase xerD homolog n=1 Tax=Amphiura filiformis TaxID=82378 RepID=UPI003B214243
MEEERLKTIKGAWKCLTSSLQDPTLKHLASVNLPALLMSAKATSTTKKYLASWKKWEAWASSNPEVSTFPVSPFHFSLYISHLAATGPKSIAVSAAAAVSWAHGLAGIPSPTSNSMVKTALQGFKRLRSTPTVRKEPITSDTLVKLFSSHGHSNANLADLRVLFTCFVSYAGFLRFDDLSLITRRDCTVSTDRMTIHLAKSKSDQYRDGADVVIARTSKPTCPVVVAERFFKALGDPPDSPLPVLRRLVSTRSGLIPSSSSLSYTRTREIVLNALSPLVPDITLYGLHSLRSGGASAACNAHVPSFLISKHGRWKTEKARNAYLKLDSSTTLLASKSLGI